MKNIDNEINKLLAIKRDVLEVNSFIRQCIFDVVPISQCKYNEFASDDKLKEDTVYYVLDPEIGQYIEGYIY